MDLHPTFSRAHSLKILRCDGTFGFNSCTSCILTGFNYSPKLFRKLFSQVQLGWTLYDMQPFSVPIQMSLPVFLISSASAQISLPYSKKLFATSIKSLRLAGSGPPIFTINRLRIFWALLAECDPGVQSYFRVSYRPLGPNYLVSNTHVHMQGDTITGDYL